MMEESGGKGRRDLINEYETIPANQSVNYARPSSFVISKTAILCKHSGLKV